MTLQNWLNNNWLKTHQTSKEEVRSILEIIDRDLRDCAVPEISPDWRFAIAYNAALQCCTIALYCKGYKPSRGQSEHYRVIQSLSLTMGSKYIEIRDYLNTCRVKRNLSDYDASGRISLKEVIELTDTAHELRSKLVEWLNNNYPEFM